MQSRRPPVAAIDLGTNTVLMVVGRECENGRIEILDDVHQIARMGRGVDKHRRVQPDAIDRVCRMLREYRRRAGALGIERLCAFGTSALRDAANKAEVISTVREVAGVDLVEVNGPDEARLTFRGAAFDLDVPSRYGVIDIGGGSTEIAMGRDTGHVEISESADVGAVRVTERFFSRLPPSRDEIRQATQMIASSLASLPRISSAIPIIGVAGTVTTLGAMDAGSTSFDDGQLNGHELTYNAVSQMSDTLLELNYEQIQAIPQINEQRADIISAGALILRQFLALGGHRQVMVSTRGIRYGLLLEMLAQQAPSSP
jgi:exopolyphosphatase/guanosine-5'-triphosphate,3'-diphosphate pyrophosphatase